MRTNGCGGTCGQYASGNQCDANGTCKATPPPPTWTCDPAKGYTVYIYSPNGKWETKVSPAGAYYQGAILADGTQLSLQFDCSELPASVLVTGGSQATQIWVADNTLPEFGVWTPYSGPLVINPSYKADITSKNFYLPFTPNAKILIRIPSLEQFPANQPCQNGTCVCQPNCSGKQCGPDGCGGTCGNAWHQ